MYLYLQKYLQFAILVGLFGLIKGEAILFDLGGVLVDTNKVAALREVGLTNLVKYVVEQRKVQGIGQHLRDRLFSFLETLEKRREDCPAAYDERGTLLPQCMCRWLTGSITADQLLQLIEEKAERNPEFFISSTEKRVLCSVARMMFNPTRFTKTRAVNQAGLEFVRACRAAGHKTYILSNWEKESFELLKKDYPEFEELFDGVVISGAIGYIKPDKQIYDTILAKYHLNPTQCIFLDDRPENLEAAEELGITVILCSADKVKTFVSIYDEINQWLIQRRAVAS